VLPASEGHGAKFEDALVPYFKQNKKRQRGMKENRCIYLHQKTKRRFVGLKVGTLSEGDVHVSLLTRRKRKKEKKGRVAKKEKRRAQKKRKPGG